MDTQIEIGQFNNTIQRFLPDFILNLENKELPYIIAGDLSTFLIDAIIQENNETICKGFELIEELHIKGSKETRELATIGILESLQNQCSRLNIESKKITNYLGPETKKWWDQLNLFWSKEINYVGETINKRH